MKWNNKIALGNSRAALGARRSYLDDQHLAQNISSTILDHLQVTAHRTTRVLLHVRAFVDRTTCTNTTFIAQSFFSVIVFEMVLKSFRMLCVEKNQFDIKRLLQT